MIDFLIIGIIFAYAAWTLFRYVKKSKKGACASCALNKSCKSACSLPGTTLHHAKAPDDRSQPRL
ncbi:FeoB-associated Cys-rich membrane protein [Paenibacillus chibensis]|uniref:FeoB-associated Cys-rich membrane protein n=1 Tax=Paenibacillus chibensis TaxID=59846 RepID=A0ABU6PVX1_9BACL|nr:FeoB-associated Cys-rich membrane protein [Paenibacillus chibensis]